MRVRRRHEIILIRRRNPLVHQALLQIALDDRLPALLPRPEQPLLYVQSHPGFTRPRIGPVTRQAILRQNRPNVPVELDGLCPSTQSEGESRATENDAPFTFHN